MGLWRKYDLYIGKQVALMSGEREVVGVHAGIDGDGSLLLDVEGEIRRFQSGEVSLRAG